ncbi:MAG: hypothetical protein HFG32_10660 [Eubacterium sp.]|jgi:signal transduction histidine kinase|nr:hypothetical protein [Eubacterium sp.]
MRENIIVSGILFFLCVSGTIVASLIIHKIRAFRRGKWERVLECVTQDMNLLVLIYYPRKRCVEYVSESVSWLFGIKQEKVMQDVAYLFEKLDLSKQDEMLRKFCESELLLSQQNDFTSVNTNGSVRSFHIRTASCGGGRNILTIADRTRDWTREYEQSVTLKATVEAFLREREEKELVLTCLKQMVGNPYHEVNMAFQQVSEMICDVVEATRSGDETDDSGIISMGELIREVVAAVMPQFTGRGQQLKLDVSVTDQRIAVDEKRLKQVIRNLLENASLYTPGNGTITLAVSEQLKAGSLQKEYTIMVEDDGIGIAPEFMPKLFMPFERANDPRVRSVQGDGLGLVVVKRILDDMGGRIEVESRLEGGTRFRVYLDM